MNQQTSRKTKSSVSEANIPKANTLMIEEGKKRGARTAFQRAEELKPFPHGG